MSWKSPTPAGDGYTQGTSTPGVEPTGEQHLVLPITEVQHVVANGMDAPVDGSDPY